MRQFLGALLLGCGILLAGLSGLCSLLLLIEESSWTGPAAAESLSIIGVVGGIPFVIGLGMAFLGWKLLRADHRPPPVSSPLPGEERGLDGGPRP